MPLMQVTANTASVHSVEGCTCLKRQRTIGTPCSQPPPPEREPLTDEQVIDIAENFKSQYAHSGVTFDEFDFLGFAGGTQRAHGIGDTYE